MAPQTYPTATLLPGFLVGALYNEMVPSLSAVPCATSLHPAQTFTAPRDASTSTSCGVFGQTIAEDYGAQAHRTPWSTRRAMASRPEAAERRSHLGMTTMFYNLHPWRGLQRPPCLLPLHTKFGRPPMSAGPPKPEEIAPSLLPELPQPADV